MRAGLWAVGLLLCLMGSMFAEEKTLIEAEGVGKTPRDALQQALRAVVEQGVQSWVQARSVLINQQLREDIVHTVAQGYVKQYEVLEERQEGELWRVRVRASVSTKGIPRVSEVPALYRQAGEPRVLVLIEEKVDGVQVRNRHPARSALIETLRREGIRVVECPNEIVFSPMHESIPRTNQEKTISPDTPLPNPLDRTRLRVIAQQADAEIVLVGRAEASYFGSFAEGEVHSVRATMELQAFWAEDGEIIASLRMPPVAVADFQKATAETLALERCARACATEFLPLMVLAFVREITEGRTVCIRIEGDYAQMIALRRALERYERTIQVQRAEYTDGEGRLWVRVIGEPTLLGDFLTSLQIEGKRVQVSHQSGTGRELRVRLR